MGDKNVAPGTYAGVALTTLYDMVQRGEFVLRNAGLVQNGDDISAPPGIDEDTFNGTVSRVENHLQAIYNDKARYPTVEEIRAGVFNNQNNVRDKINGENAVRDKINGQNTVRDKRPTDPQGTQVRGGRRKSKGRKTQSKSRKSKGCKTKSKGRK